MQAHLKIWGSNREGMSEQGHQIDVIENVTSQASLLAALDDGQVMLITRGAIELNILPPGFVCYIAPKETGGHNVSNFFSNFFNEEK